ncbi:MAG: pentapeptide repeat-containing protein [Leptolyngbyaceae cyanobacterium MO_188.B28]|nr:pentapeptide repeat-containing protein [Leptolyngbyaceae cyanobacterium MO_188.B28]
MKNHARCWACKDSIFIGAELSGANFSKADLTAAEARDTTLNQVDFSGANLTSVDFRQADLNEVDFYKAGLYFKAGRLTGKWFQPTRVSADFGVNFFPL